jgi:tetratricopeptide (TPR) repeat protein
MLGALKYREKEFDQAAKEFESAGDLVQKQPAALLDYALCLVHLNREADAIPPLRKLVALDPKNAVARYDLALIQWKESDLTGALTTLEPLLHAEPADSRSLRLAAAIHEANNHTPEAVELLRSAILANPDDDASYLDFATLAFAHASFSVGIDIVSTGLSRLPNSAALYMARGVLYGQNGDFEKAMEDFEHARELDPVHSMAATAEGVAQSQRQNHDAALASFRTQVREHPKDALGYYLLAEALSWAPQDPKSISGASHSMAEAILMATKATSLNPHLVEAWDLLASLYLQTDRPLDAEKTSRTALAITPKDQQALYTLILALRKTGAKDELKGLVQELTELRKEEQTADSEKSRYGRLIEAP